MAWAAWGTGTGKMGGSNSDNQGAKEIIDDVMDFLGMQVGVFADSLSSIARCISCLLYTSPSPRDGLLSRMPSSA